jgi:hypothetical protein
MGLDNHTARKEIRATLGWSSKFQTMLCKWLDAIPGVDGGVAESSMERERHDACGVGIGGQRFQVTKVSRSMV